MPWKPQPRDWAQVFSEQNPWHTSGAVPAALAPRVERPLAALLWQSARRAAPLRYQVVLGPRRVGKTTVMYQTVSHLIAAGVPAERLWWLRLDHPLLLRADLGDLVRSILSSSPRESRPIFIFLDELTYSEQWDLWLKTFFDEKWPVRIFSTSSSTAALKHGRRESGVGRWDEQYLAPWSFSEYLRLRERPIDLAVEDSLEKTLARAIEHHRNGTGFHTDLRRFLLVGAFPELLSVEPTEDEESEVLRSQRVLRADAVERSVYKDLPQAFGISEPLKLERLLYTVAGQLAGIFSARTLASDLGLSAPTVESYFGYLQQAFLVFALPNYGSREETVQRRGRKVYFTDGAVRNAALQRGIAPTRDPAEMGLLLENAVAAQLHALAEQTGVRLYHWRHRKLEVDLVYDHPSEPVAFEIASSPRHGSRGLVEFQKRHARFLQRCYLVIPETPAVLPTESADGVGRLPLEMFLAAVGLQAEKALRGRLE